MTGKPVSQGGIRGRKEATGRGLFYALREVCSHDEDMRALGLSTGLDGKRVVIWQFAARELAFGDWKLIALR